MSTQRRHTSRQMLLLCFCLCLLCNFADAMLDTHHPGEASTAIESGSPKDTPLNTARRHLNTEAASAVNADYISLAEEGFGTIACSMSSAETDVYYDAGNQVWTVDDQLYEAYNHKLDKIVECAHDGDTIVFNTTQVLRPRKKIIIRANIKLTAAVPGFDMEQIPEAEHKTIFTCPSGHEGIFSIESANVTLANMVIQDCKLAGDVPVSIEKCPWYEKNHTVTMLHMEFLNNNHPHGAPAVMVIGPSCFNLDLKDIAFRNNSCNATTTAVVEASVGSSIHAQQISASGNNCTVFMMETSRMVLANSNFSQNKGVIFNSIQEARGAALRFQNVSTGHITDCLFVENHAKYGGAIFIGNSSVIIGDNLEFRENLALDGGALYVKEKSTAHLTNSNFTKNHASDRGGAVNNMNGSTLIGENLMLKQNSAYKGGGIVLQRSMANISNSVIVGSSCEEQAGGHGGGLYLIRQSKLVGRWLTFDKNTAEDGGAIFLQGSHMTLSQSEILSNHALREGGGFYLMRSTVKGSDLKFLGNSGINGGAVSFHQGSEGKIFKSVFNDSYASENGGAIFVTSNSVFEGRDLEFKDNMAEAGGGGINANHNSVLTLFESIFENNQGREAGGAIVVLESKLSPGANLTFSGNLAGKGGGICIQVATVEFHNISFVKNEASSFGGGVFLYQSSSLNGSQMSFVGNHAGDRGGAILSSEAETFLSELTVQDNSAGRNGGGVYLGRGYPRLVNSTFIGNKADMSGGAVYSFDCDLIIQNTEIHSNNAFSGGGLFLEDAHADLSNMSFTENIAQFDGGAICGSKIILQTSYLIIEGNEAEKGGGVYIGNSVRAELVNTSLVKNKATQEGGAIYATVIQELSGRLLQIEQNQALSGAGIFVTGVSAVHLSESTFTQNTAQSTGAAVYTSVPNFSGADLKIHDNKATYGGGIYASFGDVLLSNISFTRNTAVQAGGGCIISQANVEATHLIVHGNAATEGAGIKFQACRSVRLLNSNFTKNDASARGGGLYLHSTDSFSMQDLLAAENKAENGSGVYVLQSKGQLTSSKISHNAASHNGGAVYAAGTTIVMSDLDILQNRAASGGGVYLTEGMARLIRSNFKRNTASDKGGALHAVSLKSLTLDGIKATENTAASGSGMYIAKTDDVQLLRSKIFQNAASQMGGAIHAVNATLTAQELDVHENKAVSGGGMYLEAGTSHLSDVSFLGNAAKLNGGACFVFRARVEASGVTVEENTAEDGGGMKIVESLASLNNTSFSKNTAAKHGGAIHAIAVADLSAEHLQVIQNSAVSGSGFYLSKASNVKLSNPVFAQNEAEANGGAIYASTGTLTMEYPEIHANKAVSGGAIFIEDGSVKLSGGALVGNKATLQGGAICSSNASVEASHIHIQANAAPKGAGMKIKKGSVLLTHSNFSENKATEDGGAVHAIDIQLLSAQSLVVNANSARSGSGFFISDTADVQVVSSEFSLNAAAKSGGAIYATHIDKILLQHMTVSHNQAKFGAGYLFEQVTPTLKNNSFTQNIAKKHGGGLSATSVPMMQLIKVQLTENKAAFGGGIYLQETVTTLFACVFTKNHAEDAGGAISGIVTSTVNGDQLVFEDNRATLGGGIYASESQITLEDTAFAGNAAAYKGGAVMATSDAALIGTGLRFERNKAIDGGAVNAELKTNLTIKDTILTSNAAEEAGGAIYAAWTDDAKLKNTIIQGNKAGVHGGGAYLRRVDHASLLEVQLHHNSAKRGGGLFLKSSSDADVSHSSFSQNTADKEGGGIYMEKTDLHGRKSTMQKNAAKDGGAVYAIKQSALHCTALTFKENQATGHGGAIFVQSSGTDCQIEDSDFYQNAARVGGAVHHEETENQEMVNSDVFETKSPGMKLWNTEFTENKAAHSGAIAFMSNPDHFRFSCDARASTESMHTLKPLIESHQDILCPNWRLNDVTGLKAEVSEFGSYAKDVKIETADEESTNRVSKDGVIDLDAPKGQSLPRMDLKLIDAFGNELDPTDEDFLWAKLVAPEGFFSVGKEMGVQVINGKETFSGIQVAAPPGEYTLELQYGNSRFRNSQPITAHVFCPPGTTVGADNSCHECGSGQLSVDGKCFECPAGATCNGQYVVPKDGRWHKTPCQIRTQRCLAEDACQFASRSEDIVDFTTGMTTCNMTEPQLKDYENTICDAGYEAPLCGSCTSGYGVLSQWKCLKCWSPGVSILVFILMAVWLGVLAHIQMNRHVHTHAIQRQATPEPPPLPFRLEKRPSRTMSGVDDGIMVPLNPRPDTPSTSIGTWTPNKEFPVELEVQEYPSLPDRANHATNIKKHLAETTKIFMNYLQLASVLTSLNVDWTSGIKKALEVAGCIGGVENLVVNFFSDCAISRYWSLARPVSRFLISLCMPLFVIGGIIGIWTVHNFFYKQEFTSFPGFVLLTVHVVLYISYLGITKMAVKMFYCVSVFDALDFSSGAQTKVLADDTSVQCWEGVHWALIAIAIVVLLVFTIGFPLYCFLRVKRHVEFAHILEPDTTIEFLYWPFAEKFYYWEVFVFARKALLATISVFGYSMGQTLQQSIAAMLLLFFLYIHVTSAPYHRRLKEFNVYEFMSLTVSTVSVTLGLVFADHDPMDHARVIISVLLSVFNLLYIMFLAIKLGTLFVEGTPSYFLETSH